MRRFFAGYLDDLLRALDRALPPAAWRGVLPAVLGGIVGWWVFVPIHELSHAFGCMAVGGTVDRLEISPEYGARWLAELFPFVAVGSDYPGQLVGFGTGGSDLVYLATVFAPYLWTICVGVPLLRGAGRRTGAGLLTSVRFGVAVPIAFAPFTNLFGDYYEMGSIVASRAAATAIAGVDPTRWRSDDLIKLTRALLDGGISGGDATVVLAGFVIGVLGALATYWLGASLHRLVASDAARSAPPAA